MSTRSGRARSSPALRCWSTTSRPGSWPRPWPWSATSSSGRRSRPCPRGPGTGSTSSPTTGRSGCGVVFVFDRGLLPLARLIIEPAKVLFLNNAINHGVLTPLGIQQATQNGKSILFLLEANPGPGAGLLLAYAIFGTGLARNTAPAALIIQFFGGIHEISFPYVLLKPLTILATIGGGMVGIFTLVVFGAGLRAPAAPGSIIAVYAQTPGNSLVGVTLSVLLAGGR